MVSHLTKDLVEAGCDEVGRGCLAGPVVAAAVILNRGFWNDEITDSKRLSKSKIHKLASLIKDQAAAYAIAELPPSFIDQHNILNASIQAMHNALDQLQRRPEYILVDGNRFKPYHFIPFKTIVKGDSKVLSIAAASIIAKDYRDSLMEKLALQFPNYGWKRNVGYPTKEHRSAIEKFGITPFHRLSFKLLK